MRIHYFQHEPHEGLGSIEDWTHLRGHAVTSTKFFENQYLPFHHDIDFLVVMGGSMSVSDIHKYPWLENEKQFILDVIRNNKPVLGICLGAQLIASSLGAKVYKNKYTEIGWFPVHFHKKQGMHIFNNGFPDETMVFHWHGDTFDIPQDALPLVSSESTKNQGFMYKNNVLALQFHFEMRPQDVEQFLSDGENLGKGKYIQDRQTMLSTDEYYEKNKQLLFQTLDILENEVK